MKGDFTRFTFQREKNYNGVRMQQGRVQLDADWNEQLDIMQYLSRTNGIDVIGACGVPRLAGGFNVSTGGTGLVISRGRIYVDGILCDSRLDPPATCEGSGGGEQMAQLLSSGIDNIDYGAQPYFPGASLPAARESSHLYLFYLDVWERHITAVEDPDIREVALGGPDTATRSQTVWQVKWLELDSFDNSYNSPMTCWNTPAPWSDLVEASRGHLAAKTEADSSQDDPCIVPADAGYRRLENQLYRVEIHQGGSQNQATFKWSRDNGTVVTRLLEIDSIQPRLLSVADPGKDEVLGFAPGQWVEISDSHRVLRGDHGIIVRLLHVEGQLLEIEAWPGGAPPEDLHLDSATVRRWDHKGVDDQDLSASGGALKIADAASDGYIELEGGVKVHFELDSGANPENRFHSGDYWLIPARAIGVNGVDGDIIWPEEEGAPACLPPMGIQHHYCRLALVSWNGSGFDVLHDCRPKFPALTEPDLYYISGDGQEAMPGYIDEPDGGMVFPGERLPQPLRVGVSNCNQPVEGAWVKFEVIDGEGTLEPDTSIPGYQHLRSSATGIVAFILPTDPQGEVATFWRMQNLPPEGEDKGQLVKTTLLREPLDSPEYELDIPVMFGASFGVAWQNRYSGARFPYPHIKRNPQLTHKSEAVEARTVETALDQLRENVSLYYVNGDGQEARPLPRPKQEPTVPSHVVLPWPLMVRVANGNWPYSDAIVEFEVVQGRGLLDPTDAGGGGPIIPVPTDNDGIARCYWYLDEWNWNQQVVARISSVPELENDPDKPSPVISDAEIRFNANLSVAEEVAYDGSDFPDLVHTELKVEHVEEALDQLRENTALHYVGGDSQEAKRGERLPQPLQVRVANGQWPRPDAMVRFAVHIDAESDGGLLEDADGNHVTQLDVNTDADGIAQCYWIPDAAGASSQRVTATLMDPLQPVVGSNGEIHFSARLSIAEQISYDGSDFPDLQYPELVVPDVEAALDQLRENVALALVSGDGQEARRGEALPRPLVVRVANSGWPYGGATVVFDISDGDGSLAAPPNAINAQILATNADNEAIRISMDTGSDGLVACLWTLDGVNWSQQVSAGLQAAGNLQRVDDNPILFNANLSIAEQVSYTSHDESELTPKPDHVQGAIDELYSHKVNRSGDTITGSLVIQGDLTVDGETTTVNTTELVIEDNIIRVNKGAAGPTSPNAGLEVFRGETLPPAQLIWSETENQWKIGLNGQLVDVAYGPNWSTLTEDKIADGLHRHSQLYADSTATVPAAQVDATGNIGIGTARPNAKLHVHGNMRLDIGEGLEMLGNNNYFGSSLDARILRMIDVNSVDGVVDGGLAFEGFTPTDGVIKPIMALRGNGNVGIGTKAPGGLLHVSCPGSAGGAYNWTTPTDMDEAANTFTAIPSVNKLVLTRNGGDGYMHVHAGSGSVTVFIDVHDPNSGAWNNIFSQTVAEIVGGEARFFFHGVVAKFADQDVDGVRLRSSVVQNQTFHGWGGMLFSFSCDRTAGLFDGVVGIRKSSPVFELDVNGIINANDIYKNGQPLAQLTPWITATNSIYYNAGNVGIGTVTPAEKLSLRDGSILLEQGDAAAVGIKFNGTAQKTVPYLRFHNPDSTTNQYVWWSARDGSLLSLEGGSVDGDIGQAYLRVTETGEVGIGTTTPRAGLVVSGSGNTGGIARSAIGIENTTANAQWLLESGIDSNFNLVNSSAGTSQVALSVTPGGNLGIGTLTADTPLEIRRDAAGALGPVLGLSNRAGGVGATSAIRFGVDTSGISATDTPNAEISAVNRNSTSNATDLVMSAWSGTATVEYLRLGGVGNDVIVSQPLTVANLTAKAASLDSAEIRAATVDTLDARQITVPALTTSTASADLISATVRRFVIGHPVSTTQNLVHASLDGPEHAVFYRGEGVLVNGTAVVSLPAYFEGLIQPGGRTVQLTAKGTTPFDLSCTDVLDGQFTVHGTQLDGAFFWEVKAVRNDVPVLEPEPVK